MSQQSKLAALKNVLDPTFILSITVMVMNKPDQETYNRRCHVVWEAIEALGFTAEELAIVYDAQVREYLGEEYTWADFVTALNLIKNELLENYQLMPYVHPLQQSAYDVIRATYAALSPIQR